MDDVHKCPFCNFAAIVDDPNEPRFQCEEPKCRKTSCLKCLVPWHHKMSCAGIKTPFISDFASFWYRPEYQLKNRPDWQRQVEEERTRAVLRYCQKCGHGPFEKDKGCNSVSCPRCHFNHCFICGEAVFTYSGHFGPEKCPLFDDTVARLGTEAARAEENAIQKLLGGDPLPEIKDIPRVPHAVHYYNLAPAPVPAPVPDVGAPPQPVQPANPEHPSPGVIAAALVISFIITMIILGVTIALLNSQPRKAHDQSLFQVIIFTNVLSLISQLIGIFPNPDARRVAGVIAALTILFHLGEAITFCVKLGGSVLVR